MPEKITKAKYEKPIKRLISSLNDENEKGNEPLLIGNFISSYDAAHKLGAMSDEDFAAVAYLVKQISNGRPFEDINDYELNAEVPKMLKGRSRAAEDGYESEAASEAPAAHKRARKPAEIRDEIVERELLKEEAERAKEKAENYKKEIEILQKQLKERDGSAAQVPGNETGQAGRDSYFSKSNTSSPNPDQQAPQNVPGQPTQQPTQAESQPAANPLRESWLRHRTVQWNLMETYKSSPALPQGAAMHMRRHFDSSDEYVESENYKEAMGELSKINDILAECKVLPHQQASATRAPRGRSSLDEIARDLRNEDEEPGKEIAKYILDENGNLTTESLIKANVDPKYEEIITDYHILGKDHAILTEKSDANGKEDILVELWLGGDGKLDYNYAGLPVSSDSEAPEEDEELKNAGEEIQAISAKNLEQYEQPVQERERKKQENIGAKTAAIIKSEKKKTLKDIVCDDNGDLTRESLEKAGIRSYILGDVTDADFKSDRGQLKGKDGPLADMLVDDDGNLHISYLMPEPPAEPQKKRDKRGSILDDLLTSSRGKQDASDDENMPTNEEKGINLNGAAYAEPPITVNGNGNQNTDKASESNSRGATAEEQKPKRKVNLDV